MRYIKYHGVKKKRKDYALDISLKEIKRELIKQTDTCLLEFAELYPCCSAIFIFGLQDKNIRRVTHEEYPKINIVNAKHSVSVTGPIQLNYYINKSYSSSSFTSNYLQLPQIYIGFYSVYDFWIKWEKFLKLKAFL